MLDDSRYLEYHLRRVPLGTPIAPIRVGFVVHVMEVAGAEVLVAEIIRRLRGRIQPVIICLDAVGSLGELLASQGVDVVCLNRRPGVDLRVALRAASQIRRRRLDIIHAHQYTPFFYAALARSIVGKRVRLVFTEHGRHYPDIVSVRRRLVNRLILSHVADEITAVCSFSAQSLSERDGFAGRHVRVIGNGVDLDRYGSTPERSVARERLGFDASRRIVANIARFHPVKDQATLVRAFAEVARERHDIDLVLVGDGPLRGVLEQLVGQLGICDRVKFLGVRQDVPLILRAVDIFVLTSVSEAASITLLEAMASGVPVVVTAVGGNPELIHDNVEGLLVPRGDVQATARALVQLLDDPQKRRSMGAAGSKLVRDHYQLGDIVERYFSLYAELAVR